MTDFTAHVPRNRRRPIISPMHITAAKETVAAIGFLIVMLALIAIASGVE